MLTAISHTCRGMTWLLSQLQPMQLRNNLVCYIASLQYTFLDAWIQNTHFRLPVLSTRYGNDVEQFFDDCHRATFQSSVNTVLLPPARHAAFVLWSITQYTLLPARRRPQRLVIIGVCLSVRTVFVRKISQERVHGSPPNLVGGSRGWTSRTSSIWVLIGFRMRIQDHFSISVNLDVGHGQRAGLCPPRTQ